jgi:hypothetical protein
MMTATLNDSQQTLYRDSLNPESVVRILKHENPYLMIDRETVQDERLSWEARGLLVYLLSLPADWDIRVRHLQKQGSAGRDALRKILRELQQFGYVSGFGESERGERGRFGQTEIRVYETPRLNPYHLEEELPAPEKPSLVDCPAPDQPATDLPAPEKPSPYKGDNQQRRQLTKDTHTQRDLRAADAGAPAVVVCGGSKFSLEDCRRYADHLHASGQGVTNPGGFARTIHNTGSEDPQIALWLAEIDPERVRSGELATPTPIDISACPDCLGRGLYYPEPQNPNKGVKRCPHSRLVKVA